MFAENFGALYEEVDAREPDSAKHVGLHTYTQFDLWRLLGCTVYV